MSRSHPTPASSLASRLALATLAALLPACGRACKNDHPYVPYTVGDAPSSSADAGAPDPALASASDAGAAPESPAEPALLAPAGATRWRTEGIELVAPEGSELVAALVRDFDGDGVKDALALVRRPAPEGKPSEVGPGQIVHYAGVSAGTPVPYFVATAPHPRGDAGCTPLARLERIGPRSAFVEVGARCARGAASRSLFVVRLAKSPSVAFGLEVADPAAAPRLSFEVEAADRDRDGIDDVTLRLTLEAGGAPFEPGPKVTAKVAFFDRPAGPSRDVEEPDASLRAIAAQATQRAAKTKEAPSVPGLVHQMRALYRAICVEGGAPRLLDARGSGSGAVSCGASKPLEDAGIAEARAFVAQGDALRALASLAIAQVPPATKTAARAAELKKLVEDVAPTVQAKSVKTLSVTLTTTQAAHPVWGPLGFEPSGRLLVRSGATVTRFDPESGEGADAEMPAWPTEVLSPDGRSRWLEAYHACEGVALRATFVPVGEGDMQDVMLPVAPPLGTRCAGGRGEAAATTPIAWTARGLEAIVAGTPLLVRPEAKVASILASATGEMPPLGSPRSPGGRSVAHATPYGVLVKGVRAVRVRSPELEPYEDLRHCTTTDDGSRVACVKKGKVVIAFVDAP